VSVEHDALPLADSQNSPLAYRFEAGNFSRTQRTGANSAMRIEVYDTAAIMWRFAEYAFAQWIR